MVNLNREMKWTKELVVCKQEEGEKEEEGKKNRKKI